MSTYRESRERDLHVWVHQIVYLPCEGFLDVRHEGGIHFWQTIGSVDANNESSSLPVNGNSIGKQQIAEKIAKLITALIEKILAGES